MTPRRALPAAVLVLGALLPMARVLPSIASSLPGDPRGDVYKHVWSFWHVLESPGLHTEMLNAPEGGVLVDLMWLPALLMAPVTAIAGPVLASNLWLILSFLAIGAATAGLAHELTERTWPSVFAGLCAQTAPMLLGYPLESGVHERFTAWVFPLVLLALLKAGRRGSIGWGVAGTVGLGFATMGCQVYGVFAVIMGVCCIPLWVGRSERKHLFVLLGTLAGMGVTLGLVWAVVRHGAVDPESLSLQPMRTNLNFEAAPHTDGATAHWLLDPRPGARPQQLRRGDVLIRAAYLGWVPLLAGVLGAVIARQRRAVATIVLAGLIAAVLACGQPIRAGMSELWNPLHAAFVHIVPTYGRVPALWQQTAVVAPLVAVGLAALLARLPRRWALVVGSLLFIATLAERGAVLNVPFVGNAFDVPDMSLYDAIDEPGPVVEIPRAYRGGSTADPRVFLAQTRHGQPIPVAINVGTTALDRYLPVLDGASTRWVEPTECLRAGGFRWLVVHGDAFRDNAYADVYGKLVDTLGEPVADDGVSAIFDLGPVREAAPGPPPIVGEGAGAARRASGGCPY